MSLFHSTDPDGISIINPDINSMRELLAHLDDPGADDVEHPDVSLVHDPSGWSISVFPDGTVTLENLDESDEPPLYMNGVSRGDALQLWIELSKGKFEVIQSRPWIRGVE